jgi:protein SPT2
MALSATRTRESQLAAEHALQERQRREALHRKQQEEKEAKERELEKKRRLQMFEEEKRQQERLERMEAERRAKEAARERKEEAQKYVLLYGAKKAAKMVANANGGSSPKYPMSAAAKEAAAKKPPAGGDSDEEDFSGLALTREELRQRKREAELRKQFARGTTKKHSSTGYRKNGQLPGGAVNIVVNANGESVTPVSASADLAAGKSLKERLTQGPNTLVLLQTKARDRRTVDEAQQDIRIKLGKATSKVLSGEEARTFDDWFGSSKHKASPAPRSCSPTPTPTPSASSKSG